jgi:hypothetical protein
MRMRSGDPGIARNRRKLINVIRAIVRSAEPIRRPM